MSGLEYLIGETISCFPDNRLPTIKDVLCFYAQFWGMRESDSIKENFVADQLRKFYQQKNIPVADKKSIKHQISRNVSSLRTILRFKSKKKTPTNIQKETVFRALLNETFEIRSENQTVNEHEIASTSNGSSMEVENFDGIYLIFFCFWNSYVRCCNLIFKGNSNYSSVLWIFSIWSHIGKISGRKVS